MRRVYALARDWLKARPPQRGRYALPVELIQDVWAWDQQDRIEAYVAGYEAARAEAKAILFRELNEHTPAAAIVHIGQMGD